MLQPNSAVESTVMGRKLRPADSVENVRRCRQLKKGKIPRSVLNAYNGKSKKAERAPEPDRNATDTEYRDELERMEARQKQIDEFFSRRIQRLLQLFLGRREQALRKFEGSRMVVKFTTADDEAGAYQRRAARVLNGRPEFISTGPIPDLEKFVPHVFSFELWLLHRIAGREKDFKPVMSKRRSRFGGRRIETFDDVWHFWIKLDAHTQVDELLLRREKR